MFAVTPSGVEVPTPTAAPPPPPERWPRIFDQLGLAEMATVAVCGIPQLTYRVERDVNRFAQRIRMIG